MVSRRILCVLVLFAVFLCSCGTNGTADSSDSSLPNKNEPTVIESISLLYRTSDSLNPYTAKSELNQQLSSLLYDPLVKLDTNYQPYFVLAKEITYNKKVCTITLKSAKFSDQSEVTAEDIVYSYSLAKNSSLNYSKQLSCVESFKAENQTTIVVTLKKADPYFANLLDFPIIKSGSDKLTNQDKILLTPIGSGRYTFNEDTQTLIANNNHINGKPNVPIIKLINAPDETVVKHNLETGAVSVYYSELSDGIIPPMSGNINQTVLNNIVYLGVNLSDNALSKVELRYAISSALDRNEICSGAYHSYATAATGIFNPIWEDAKGLQNISSSPDMQNVVANFEVIGYNSKDADGFYVDDKGKGITLSLVSYNGNSQRSATAELVKKQLEAAGIHINLKSLGWNEYLSALQSGNFDLYIAETKLMGNMNVSELITSNGSLSYGIPNTSTKQEGDKTTEAPQGNGQGPQATPTAQTVDSTIDGFYNEKLSLVDIINAFNAELPIIPLCYRNGVTVCEPGINVENVSSMSDVYFGISNIISN